MRDRRTGLGLILAVLLLTPGCGSATKPTDVAPVLATRLDGVDAAIAAGDYDQARTALRALVTSTTRVERAGDLDQDQADRITTAAAALLERLPGDAPTKEPTPTGPTTESSPKAPETTASRTPAPREEHDTDKGRGKGKGKGKGD